MTTSLVVEQTEQKSDQSTSRDIEYIKSLITECKDFPKPGIVFRNIFPALRDPKAYEMIITRFVFHLQTKYGSNIDVICGLDSRGFLFAPLIAIRLKCAFVPIRKQGKLPGNCVSVQFVKEYGEDRIEIEDGSIIKGQKVVLCDDLLATGGTLEGAYKLVTHNKVQGCVLESIVVIELLGLKGRQRLNNIGMKNIFSLVTYD